MASVVVDSSARAKLPASELTRWSQIILGAICMLVPGTLLYGWTVFVGPLDQAHHWGRPAIQTAFTFFVVSEACLMWLMGPLVDRYGPRPTMFGAGILVALGGYLNSQAESLSLLYMAAAVSGIGAGIVTCATIASAVRWFPDRHRGFAVGITVTGFALGALITVLPMVDFIETNGYRAAFLWFGGVMGLLLMAVALVIRFPKNGEAPESVPAGVVVRRSRRDYTPFEMLKSAPFWVLFAMFTFICMGGHLVTAHLAPIATDYKTANVEVSLFFGALTVTGLKLALIVDRVCNVLGRPFFGFISDRIGREYTMAIAFLVEAVGIYALLQVADNPFLFAVLSGAVFFAFGEIYVLMPTIIADIYGEKHAATNYGVLYIAKGLASAWVPIGSWLVIITGGWDIVFYIAAVADLVAVFLALLLLRLRRKLVASEN